MTGALVLGAPGIYRAPPPVDRSYRGVRLDIAGFVGVAPRGPLDTPVRVRSWSEFERRFGGRAPGARLGWAVAAFFDQGGVEAYAVRVAPRQGRTPGSSAPEATARFRLDGLAASGLGPPELAAADEGTWGNHLTIALRFVAGARFEWQPAEPAGAGPPDAGPPDAEPPDAGPRELPLPDALAIPAGSLLQLRLPGRRDRPLRWVTAVVERPIGVERRRCAVLDAPLPPLPGPGADRRVAVTVVEGELTVADGDPTAERGEVHTRLGLHPLHPRWLAAVLQSDSTLLAPSGPWTEPLRPASDRLAPVTAAAVHEGRDRDVAITAGDFFDDRWDPLEDGPYRGVHALLAVRELGMVLAPDLLWDTVVPAPLPEPDRPPPAPASFVPCTGEAAPAPATSPASSVAVLLDARTKDGLDEAIRRQGRLVELAEQQRRFTALLDAPPGLPLVRLAQWRAAFDSAYAAAYHPWLGVRDPASDRIVPAPPSAFAAGIIASRERRLGLPWGPANELAAGAVLVADPVPAAEHDQLHPLGINVFLLERDGARLTAARTLARDPTYRQLSVCRLLTMLRLTIERDAQWMVFEPNDRQLWAAVRFNLIGFLRQLYRGGAFAGTTEEESFFVTCDERLNPAFSVDQGRLVVEVGVAPAEPLEFIVLRVERSTEGAVQVEERRG